MAKELKKKEEEVKTNKRRKEEQAMATILAQRWAQEDENKKNGIVAPAPSQRRRSPSREEERNRGRRRRDRDEDLPSQNRVRADDDGRKRRHLDFKGGDDSEEEAPGKEEAPAPDQGGWKAVVQTTAFNLASSAERPATSSERRPAAPKPKHGAKVAGLFGLSDSEDEKDTIRKELEAAKRSRQTKMSIGITPARIATPGASITAAGSASSAPLATSSNVQMRLAQWKMTCKGKWVDMPPDLRVDVERCMGKNGSF